MKITINFVIILVGLLALSLVELVSCQTPAPTVPPAPSAPPAPQPSPQGPQAPQAPVNVIPTTIGTVTKPDSTTTIPQQLIVPSGQDFAFILYASGNLQYKCVASANQWIISNADVILINDKNDAQVFNAAFQAVHFNISQTPINGGNDTWTSSIPSDNSQVIAKVVDSVNSTQSNNIPWEMYMATSTLGDGRLSNVSYVLRVNTIGGVSPAQSQCGVQYSDGSPVSVHYTADYWFYYGPLPNNETQPQPTHSSKTNDGHSTKPIGKLNWVAIVVFISVGVTSF